jgi:hypothetical protein
VVNVYGNSNEGDQSAGLDFTGPAGSDEVGRAEAEAMLAAWRRAGRRLSRRPALGARFTRVCFCGQAFEGGRLPTYGVLGANFLTGSEEERGPLFEITGIPFEGNRSPFAFDTQGHKIPTPATDFPRAVPLMVVRVGDRLIASLPGEPTKEVGARVRQALLGATAASGIRGVAIAGLVNEFVNYITTAEEYDRQHYEGASTLFGPLESNFLRAGLTDLARRLVEGRPSPVAHPFDPTYGVRPDGPAFPAGAAAGRVLAQPAPQVGRLGHARISWQGGPLGYDRPVETPFLVAERRVGRRWRQVDSDLGLAMLWRVDSDGRHDAYWEIPRDAPRGIYRLVVRATRYRLDSRPFRVVGTGRLRVERVASPPGDVAVRLAYPAARENVDLTARPAFADGGRVRFRIGPSTVTITLKRGTVFSVPVPAGVPVSVVRAGASDRFGNVNSEPAALAR